MVFYKILKKVNEFNDYFFTRVLYKLQCFNTHKYQHIHFLGLSWTQCAFDGFFRSDILTGGHRPLLQ